MMLQHIRYPMKSDVKERKDTYLLEIDLPGCSKKDIRVNLEDGYLIVSATIHKENGKNSRRYIRKECYSGNFTRSFFVGSNISQDDIKASYKRGVLRLIIPKDKKMSKTSFQLVK